LTASGGERGRRAAADLARLRSAVGSRFREQEICLAGLSWS
jgi:hypothetical protein